jgi:hypothetical protein
VDRRTRNLFALVLVLVIALTGGAALVLSEVRPAVEVPDDGPDRSFVTGVVVKVDSRSLTDVRSFTLSNGYTVFDFQVGELENADEFPPAHLLEHQATAQPVRAYYHLEDGVRFATRLEDAEN